MTIRLTKEQRFADTAPNIEIPEGYEWKNSPSLGWQKKKIIVKIEKPKPEPKPVIKPGEKPLPQKSWDPKTLQNEHPDPNDEKPPTVNEQSELLKKMEMIEKHINKVERQARQPVERAPVQKKEVQKEAQQLVQQPVQQPVYDQPIQQPIQQEQQWDYITERNKVRPPEHMIGSIYAKKAWGYI